VTLAITILSGITAASIAAVLTHRLTSLRDLANRRSELRIRYLLDAYRSFADTAHRPLIPDSGDTRRFEQALADVQLLGSDQQAATAAAIAKTLADDRAANLDDLLLSLRDDLRRELALCPISAPPVQLRIEAT
jgi:hypothetical protein